MTTKSIPNQPSLKIIKFSCKYNGLNFKHSYLSYVPNGEMSQHSMVRAKSEQANTDKMLGRPTDDKSGGLFGR